MLIGELARRSGLSKDGIRHYEKLGIITSTRRRAGSRWYREYGNDAVERIRKTAQAQRLGLTLKEIAPLLREHERRRFTEQETVRFLEERLAIVRSKIEALRTVEELIRTKLARHGGATVAEP